MINHYTTTPPSTTPRHTLKYAYYMLILYAYFMLTACLLRAYCMLNTCLLRAYYVLTTCLLGAYYLLTTRLLQAYYVLTTCLLRAYYVLTTCVLHAYYVRQEACNDLITDNVKVHHYIFLDKVFRDKLRDSFRYDGLYLLVDHLPEEVSSDGFVDGGGL